LHSPEHADHVATTLRNITREKIVKQSSRSRIDVHFHSVPPSYRAAIQGLGPTVRTPDWTPELAIDFLDQHDSAAGIMSISVPGTHLGDNAKARILAKRCNEESAEYITRFPDRLGAFGTVPLPDIEGACDAAKYALDSLKLDGIGLFASYNGRYLGDPAWDPLLELLDQRSAVCHVHPNTHPSVHIVRDAGINPGIPNFMAEYLFDTTRAALNLLFYDVLDRFPNIRFVLSHAGGTLPYMAWRVAAIVHRQVAVAPMSTQYPSRFVQRHAEDMTPDTVLSRLKLFWYDTALSPGPQTLGSLLAVADPGRILFGGDWPYCPSVLVGDMIEALRDNPLLSEAQIAAIESGNALKLFPRFA
jgi:6-methylsalicylate decarboxylase